MFSLSHPVDGTFRLEIHASPSEMEDTEASRLRSVLLGLARELKESREGDHSDDGPVDDRALPTRPTGPRKLEASL